MPNICIVYDEEIYGECEAAYDVDTGELIHEWNCNDATWRAEYLEPIFTHYGFNFVDDPKGKFHKKFQKYLKETYSEYLDEDENEEDA